MQYQALRFAENPRPQKTATFWLKFRALVSDYKCNASLYMSLCTNCVYSTAELSALIHYRINSCRSGWKIWLENTTGIGLFFSQNLMYPFIKLKTNIYMF